MKRGLSPIARTAWLMLAMLLAVGLAELLRPTQQLALQMQAVHLHQQVPEAFAGWRIDDSTVPVLPDPSLQARLDTVYDQTLARSYVNASGERVMLTIAYGRNQSSEATAVHRPEFCYGAQGFQIRGGGVERVPLGGEGGIAVQRLVGTLGQRVEPISYWVTLADQATLPGLGRKLAQLRLGLAGYVADGMLVRVSTVRAADGTSTGTPAGAAYAAQDRFLQDLARALPSGVRVRYFGV